VTRNGRANDLFHGDQACAAAPLGSISLRLTAGHEKVPAAGALRTH
jgi:hypothetical protein